MAHFEHLDSLKRLAARSDYYDELKRDIHLFEIQKRDMRDFAKAFDGDSSAFTRLERRMETRDKTEMFHLFFGLYEIDSLRALRKLRELTQNENWLKRDSLLIAHLNQINEWSKELARRAGRADSIAALKLRRNITQSQIDLLRLHRADSFGPESFRTLEALLLNGDSSEYALAYGGNVLTPLCKGDPVTHAPSHWAPG